MPKALTIAILLTAALSAARPARAESNCWVPMTDWQPRSAVEAVAQANGWALRRIKVDDGCYEMLGTDADGVPIEVRLHPSTLKILTVHRPSDEKEGHSDKNN